MFLRIKNEKPARGTVGISFLKLRRGVAEERSYIIGGKSERKTINGIFCICGSGEAGEGTNSSGKVHASA